MFRLFLVGIVLAIVYFVVRKMMKKMQNPMPQIDSDEMFECDVCGTYVSEREMITTRGKHYCSQECLKAGR